MYSDTGANVMASSDMIITQSQIYNCNSGVEASAVFIVTIYNNITSKNKSTEFLIQSQHYP